MTTDIDRRAKDHWAFQPLAAPSFTAAEQQLHPIDALIQRQLQSQNLHVVGPAEMPALVRRVTYDLHGLPPTAHQLATPREKYIDLVRELLASPRYGERWGRHWLDVARYSDAKDGVLMYGDARVRPFAYTYRDYVIRSFNEDLPYDQFIRHQLAADQMKTSARRTGASRAGFVDVGTHVRWQFPRRG